MVCIFTPSLYGFTNWLSVRATVLCFIDENYSGVLSAPVVLVQSLQQQTSDWPFYVPVAGSQSSQSSVQPTRINHYRAPPLSPPASQAASQSSIQSSSQSYARSYAQSAAQSAAPSIVTPSVITPSVVTPPAVAP